MRNQIRKEVELIQPLDELEKSAKHNVLSWIDSGVEIFRQKKPATPPKHLISYFVLIDGDHILLVDHINAQLWLPTGGHVDPQEHPKATVAREAQEELSINAEFLCEQPLFLSITDTVGLTAGHTDVCLWYALRGDRHKPLSFDESEFKRIQWFHKDDIPFDKTDSHMERFLSKLYTSESVSDTKQ